MEDEDPPRCSSGIPTTLHAAQRLFQAIREAEEILELPSGSATPIVSAHSDWVAWQLEVFPLLLMIVDRTNAVGLYTGPGFNQLQVQIILPVEHRARWPVAHRHWVPWSKGSNDLKALYEAIQVIKDMKKMLPDVFDSSVVPTLLPHERLGLV